MNVAPSHRRHAGQQRGAGARAERGLRAPAAERGGDVAALALLKQHDDYQQQAREHVDAGQNDVQHSLQ